MLDTGYSILDERTEVIPYIKHQASSIQNPVSDLFEVGGPFLLLG